MAQRLHITPEHLAAAYARRRQPGWPPTLAAALARPLYAALVRAEAIRAQQAERRCTATHSTPRPHPPASPAPRRAHAGLDRKRAAAGDRDD